MRRDDIGPGRTVTRISGRGHGRRSGDRTVSEHVDVPDVGVALLSVFLDGYFLY